MSLADVRGHDRIIEYLKESVDSGRTAPAYIFCGPEGVGKMFTAQQFAKALNCDKEESYGCGECESCSKIDKGYHSDVMVLTPQEGKKGIGIDQVRALQGRAALKANEARQKVFIIDEADSITEEASNAFLKTLEDVPGKTVIILISANPVRLLDTVRSRCFTLRFAGIPVDLIKEMLKEYTDADSGFADFLAGFSGGSIGKALFYAENGLENIRAKALDVLREEELPDFDDEKADREGLSYLLDVMNVILRDIALIREGTERARIINTDILDDISKLSEKISFDECLKLMNKIEKYRYYNERNVNPDLILQGLTGF